MRARIGRRLVLALTVAFVAAVLTPASAGAVRVPQSDAPGFDHYPRLDGDRIAWLQDGGSDGGADSEVFTWSPSDGTRQLTRNGVNDTWVRVSGDRVAWTAPGGSDGGADAEVFTWTPASGVQQLTTDDAGSDTPEVSGDRIVWCGSVGGDPPNYELYTWTPNEGTLRITHSSAFDWRPQVVGDRIAWCAEETAVAESGRTVSQVLVWTPAEGVQILAEMLDVYFAPEVCGDRVVWSDAGIIQGAGMVHTWAPGSDAETISVAPGAFPVEGPHIVDDRILWTDEAGVLSTWTPEDGTSVIASDCVGGSPRFARDRIVWSGAGGSDGGSDWEVFTWTPEGGVRQVTENGGEEMPMAAASERIAWCGTRGSDGGTDSEVFTWTAGEGVRQITRDDRVDWWLKMAGDRLAWASTLPGTSSDSRIHTWTPAEGLKDLTVYPLAPTPTSSGGGKKTTSSSSSSTGSSSGTSASTTPAGSTTTTPSVESSPAVLAPAEDEDAVTGAGEVAGPALAAAAAGGSSSPWPWPLAFAVLGVTSLGAAGGFVLTRRRPVSWMFPWDGGGQPPAG